MKRMRLLGVMGLMWVALLTGGCFTGRGPSHNDGVIVRFTPEQWGNIAKTASYTGAALYLEKHPEKAAAFTVAKQSLDLALANGQFNPAELREALKAIGPRVMSGTTGVVIVDSAVVLITTLQGGEAPLENAPTAKAVMQGISAGIGMALEGVK